MNNESRIKSNYQLSIFNWQTSLKSLNFHLIIDD